MRNRFTALLAVSAVAFAAALPAAAQNNMNAMMSAAASTRLVQITIENLTTGQNFSPSFIVSHTAAAAPLYTLGQTASDMLVAVAEGGNIGMFSSDAAGRLGADYGDAIIPVHTPPGGTRTFYVTVDEAHPLVSGIWMLGMTNDGFSGFSGVDAFDLSGPVTMDLKGYDAGSEINSERNGYLGALGGGNMRDPENGVIAVHTGIHGDADAPASWNFDPNLVARVTISPVEVGAIGGM